MCVAATVAKKRQAALPLYYAASLKLVIRPPNSVVLEY